MSLFKKSISRDNDGEDEEDYTSGVALPVGKCSFSREELLERMQAGIPAESPEEHFARLRHEFAPNIMKADEAALRRIEELVRDKPGAVLRLPPRVVKRPPDDLEPSKLWRKDSLQRFVESRQYLARWEDRLEDGSWQIPSLAEDLPKKNDSESWEILIAASSPSVRILIELDQKTCSKVLKDMIYLDDEKFDEDSASNVAGDARDSQLDGDAPSGNVIFNSQRCAWYYAFLSRIERPLSVGMESHLRTLLRRLHQSPPSHCRQGTDLLICLLEDYFTLS